MKGIGQVFKRTYKAADGTQRTCATWTIRYYCNDRPYQEATEYTRETAALGRSAGAATLRTASRSIRRT